VLEHGQEVEFAALEVQSETSDVEMAAAALGWENIGLSDAEKLHQFFRSLKVPVASTPGSSSGSYLEAKTPSVIA
jgi:hypothetical protein